MSDPARSGQAGEDMHVHKPKAAHSPRELLSEIGVIVIGILLAMSAEQAVEAFHWRHAVEAQRKALDGEIARRLSTADARLAQEPCIQNHLKELRVVFERHKAGKPLKLAGAVGSPSVFGGHEGVWETAAGSQTMEHMPTAERARYGSAFAAFARLEANLEDEMQSWDEIGSLDRAEILEAADWPALRAAYTRAVAWDQRNSFYSEWVLKHHAEGQKPEKVGLEWLMKLKEPTRNLCRSMLAGAS